MVTPEEAGYAPRQTGVQELQAELRRQGCPVIDEDLTQ